MKSNASEYDPATHPRQAQMLCELGAVDREVCEFLGIAINTLRSWRFTYPEFGEAMRCGKEAADDRVERALYNRAVGYDHKAVKFISVPRGGNMGSEVERHEYVEHHPPDVKACIRWLEARRPQTWRRQLQVENLNLNVDTDEDFSNLSETERGQLRTLLARAAGGEPVGGTH